MKQTFSILFLSILGVFLLNACGAPQSTSNAPLVATATASAPIEPAVTFDASTSNAGCSAITVEPTAAPSSNSLFPPVSSADFSFGRSDAPVTIVEYCDFQSAGCADMSAIIVKLMKSRADVRFIFRPVSMIAVMDKSDKAMLAALAADEQGKFWTMYDVLFALRASWEKLNPSQFNAWVVKESARFGVDGGKLQAAINSEKTTTKMASMNEATKKLKLPAVPLLLVNGNLQPSYLLDYPSLSDAVGLIALGRKQFTQCPPFSVNRLKQYIATLRTKKGDITIQLFADKAPLAVNSFVFLARQKWYDGVTFHRVIPGFIAQTGDPSDTGMGNPGYLFTESNDLKFDKPGLVAMTSSSPDTNGSQFFITFAPAPHIDGMYTIFGQVLNGLDVAEQLTPRDVAQGINSSPGDQILSVSIEEK
jgi:cyclophilin family peptidyl-prolyl cis-trans isomerase/protein-disulfide isomerase